ncbi:MAG TPA: protein kinase [Planctomycetaceae bacterium]|nr:protein kinase [Planctomycetaceae bacterium]
MDRPSESAPSDTPQPAAGEPLTVFPFPPPALAARQTADTVINLERRGSSSSLPPVGPGPAPGGSTLWPRLFPPDLGADDDSLEGPAGTRLDHFVIEERIGVGGMGAVFRAVDQRLQRVVALKVLAPVMSRDPGAVQRFQNEARAAARLDHDNIARVHYIGEDCGLHFIAFEYVTGTNLRDLIQRQGRLAPAETVNYALQIATALVHTSAAGVVHRDIKPSNIIVTPSGRAKLVDLGLARKQNSESAGDLTMAGTTLGTFDYISPEQAKDPRNVDVRSDIYSLGCTMYQMLTGEPPYPEGTVLQKLLDHQAKDPPDAAVKNATVPPELSAVIRRMMASEPRRRFATAEDLLRHLLPIAAAMGLRGLHPEGLVWVKPPSLRLRFWERHAGWMASAAVLVTLVLVVDRWPRQPAADGAAAIANGSAHAAPVETNHTAPVRNGALHPGPETAGQPPPATDRAGPFPDLFPGDGKPDLAGANVVVDEADAFPEPSEPSRILAPGAPDQDLSGDDADRGSPDRILDAFPRLSATRIPRAPEAEREAGSEQTAQGSRDDRPAGPAADPSAGQPLPPEGVAAGDPPGVQASAAPPPVPSVSPRPFVVISDGKESSRPTLEAACTDARPGSTIELRYDGRLPGVIERPYRVVNKSLTIRAGTKPGSGERYRPLVAFAADAVGDPQQTRMVALSDASVELVNVDVIVTVDSNLRLQDEQWWSLFSLAGTGSVKIQGSTVTMLNPGVQPAAVVEVAPGTASDLPGMMKTMMNTIGAAGPRFGVEISHSIVRGGCDVLVSRQGRPGRLEISQSLLAVEGSLLLATGAVDLSERDREIELTLSHLTCLVGRSLIQVDSGELPRQQLPVHVSAATNNIIAAAWPGARLVSMTGNSPDDEFRRLLRWNGGHNFYDGFDAFWSIASGRDVAPPDADDFDDWKRAWSSGTESTAEIDAVDGGVWWKRPWRTVELARMTPADVALDDASSNNPALGAASDGDDVGADLSLLPPVPRPSDPSGP